MSQAQQTRARRIKWISFLAVDAALAVVLVFLFSTWGEVNVQQELNDLGATVYPQQIPVADNFSLEDQSSRPFSAQQLQGKWSLIFFGFTNCPNICPLTMVELGQFYRTLEAGEAGDIELPQVIMVTVDPERDDKAALTEYIANYHRDFLGLTGSPEQIRAFAEQLYVVIDSAESREGTNAAGSAAEVGHEQGHGEHNQNPSAFDHSGHISIISPTGELHAVIRLPHRDQNLVDAYRLILENWN